jgi:hypothetical protein
VRGYLYEKCNDQTIKDELRPLLGLFVCLFMCLCNMFCSDEVNVM